MSKRTGKTTTGAAPRPILGTVRIALKFAADPAKIKWAYATSLAQARELVRGEWPEWEVLSDNTEIVSTDLTSMEGYAIFTFRATPTRIPTHRLKKLRRR